MNYDVPRGVGVTQVAHELNRPPITRHFSTGDFLDELSDHDIRIAKVWITGDPFDGAQRWGGDRFNMGTKHPRYEDMDLVWRHPDIDIIVARFLSFAWSANEINCKGKVGPVWAEEPTYEIARKLLKRYGDEDKVIIISEWECDWQWRGVGCNRRDQNIWYGWWMNECQKEHGAEKCSKMLARSRMDYVKRRTIERQAGVEKARAERPDAKLRVFVSITLNQFDEVGGHFKMNLAKDMVPTLDVMPDYIGVSYWPAQTKSITEVFEYIREHTGMPIDRIYIDEVGAAEKTPGLQYDRIMNVIPAAFDAGCAFACVWMWRQTWYDWMADGRPKNYGMWQWTGDEGRVEWGEPTSGLQAIHELNGR